MLWQILIHLGPLADMNTLEPTPRMLVSVGVVVTDTCMHFLMFEPGSRLWLKK